MTLLRNFVAVMIITATTSLTTASAQSPDTTRLFDSARRREIPIAVYKPEQSAVNTRIPVVILSHGYGQNAPDSYLFYSFLANFLSTNGYYVVSIQHELPTDSLIPNNGIPQIVRRPFWDRGADNILFVINKLKQTDPGLDFNNITLIGHSNGGDMTALFPQKYPGIVKRIITLDNRRMALPESAIPKVFSLRSSDLPADEGVLPTEEEQKKFNITIVKLSHTRHVEMNDSGTKEQQTEINRYVLSFLSKK